ncbi:hypothetical protein [Paenarthrobacter ilicis]|uniref:Uncharacterized protein n=1 Tax=Paenarthrobacter ilicis TaxID=43665 RepID=A0ABX0TGG7_9MICC|nr:hypothetical protein [Paenarthrobacter ilicis]MBM7791756.1 hypothetical protein [Paenarthrobacter ilicis]NIJ01619.1 hypothetical protein [Paenarthrobacter ilicis]
MTPHHGMTVPTDLSLVTEPGIHLLLMAGLVLLAGLAGTGTFVILLLITPLAKLALDHTRATRGFGAPSTRGTEDAGSRVPASNTHGRKIY